MGEQLVQRDLGDGEFRLNGDDVIRQDPHSEGDGPLGQGQADPAGPDQAEGLSIELRAVKGLFLPLVLLHGHVGPADLADRSQHEAEGVLGHGDGGGRRGVGDLDVFFLGRGRVDVVQADAGPDDDLQSGGGFDHRPGDLARAADDDGVESGNRLDEAGLVQSGLDDDVKTGDGLEQLHGFLVESVGDQDFFHAQFSLRIGSAALMDAPATTG